MNFAMRNKYESRSRSTSRLGSNFIDASLILILLCVYFCVRHGLNVEQAMQQQSQQEFVQVQLPAVKLKLINQSLKLNLSRVKVQAQKQQLNKWFQNEVPSHYQNATPNLNQYSIEVSLENLNRIQIQIDTCQAKLNFNKKSKLASVLKPIMEVDRFLGIVERQLMQKVFLGGQWNANGNPNALELARECFNYFQQLKVKNIRKQRKQKSQHGKGNSHSFEFDTKFNSESESAKFEFDTNTDTSMGNSNSTIGVTLLHHWDDDGFFLRLIEKAIHWIQYQRYNFELEKYALENTHDWMSQMMNQQSQLHQIQEPKRETQPFCTMGNIPLKKKRRGSQDVDVDMFNFNNGKGKDTKNNKSKGKNQFQGQYRQQMEPFDEIDQSSCTSRTSSQYSLQNQYEIKLNPSQQLLQEYPSMSQVPSYLEPLEQMPMDQNIMNINKKQKSEKMKKQKQKFSLTKWIKSIKLFKTCFGGRREDNSNFDHQEYREFQSRSQKYNTNKRKKLKMKLKYKKITKEEVLGNLRFMVGRDSRLFELETILKGMRRVFLQYRLLEAVVTYIMVGDSLRNPSFHAENAYMSMLESNSNRGQMNLNHNDNHIQSDTSFNNQSLWLKRNNNNHRNRSRQQFMTVELKQFPNSNIELVMQVPWPATTIGRRNRNQQKQQSRNQSTESLSLQLQDAEIILYSTLKEKVEIALDKLQTSQNSFGTCVTSPRQRQQSNNANKKEKMIDEIQNELDEIQYEILKTQQNDENQQQKQQSNSNSDSSDDTLKEALRDAIFKLQWKTCGPKNNEIDQSFTKAVRKILQVLEVDFGDRNRDINTVSQMKLIQRNKHSKDKDQTLLRLQTQHPNKDKDSKEIELQIEKNINVQTYCQSQSNNSTQLKTVFKLQDLVQGLQGQQKQLLQKLYPMSRNPSQESNKQLVDQRQSMRQKFLFQDVDTPKYKQKAEG